MEEERDTMRNRGSERERKFLRDINSELRTGGGGGVEGLEQQVVSGVDQQPGGRGAEVATRQVFRSVDGFSASVPGHGHVRPRPGTAQRQGAVRRAAQLSKRAGHRPRATGSDGLVRPSVAYMQVVGVDIAQSHADTLSRDSTAIADRPRPEAGEDPVVPVEEVFVSGATDVDARVVEPRSEDQQAEQTDGEATPQIATVWDIRVQQPVAMVIMAWELHCDSRQVGGVGEGQESRAGFPGKHILLILRSLVAPHPKTPKEEEQEEDGRGGFYEGRLETRSGNPNSRH
ncbi:hypothetical protein EYF80_009720 [Liparis tanakae]|uniref:Uncharacterized protein n=1 Tax=Liparis tanakae TaxID=230148 RepID=A0A4Z2IR22_9TELE|nr:hypothetical protein EYF80_009720 [Liparis tanakae]